MAKLPLPQRGQPIDLTYISDIVTAVNNIAASVMPTSSYKYVTVDTPASGRQSVRTSDARIIGGYVDVVSNTTVTAGFEKEFSYDFQVGEFAYAPIVTATPVNIKKTTAGQNLSVVIKEVSTSKVFGVVRFNSAGDVSVGVNLIVVGIPGN
jgi:hypothetical protein